MSDKLSRKELKQPDAFQKAGGEASAWTIQHQRTVLLAVGVAVLGGGGVALASYMSTRGEARAIQGLGAALAPLSRPVVEKETAPLEPGQEPPFKSVQERDQAVVASLTDFREKNRGGKASAIAALPLAQAELRLGKPDDALLAFDDYLKGAGADDPLRPTAYEGKGYAFEAKGQYEQALAAFDQLSKENRGEFLNGMGLYHRARVLILEGKKDEAAKTLSEIPAAAPNSSAARLANERMTVLAAEGIKVPPPAAPSRPDAG